MSTPEQLHGRSFRPEVQFLRALAVVAVVVYHINPAWLPGGFVGVDVFFVISGYLITGGILRRIEATGTFSLAQFWANRARRILPAASLVIIVSLGASLILLPPTELVETGWQALASVLYVQNLYLAWQSVDYLAGDQPPTVFQHFWSLSVEEQFYVVWPVLVVIASLLANIVRLRFHTGDAQHRRRFRAIAVIMFAGLIGASLAASVVMVFQGDQTAYFVTWARLWELGAGGMLACVLIDWESFPHARIVLQWVGVIAIIVACLVFSDETPFPGLFALIPVVATMAVIAAGRTDGFAALRPITEWVVFQKLGDWSYSIYLWHFPVLVFATHLWGQELLGWAPVGMLTATLLLAVVAFYSVEKPVWRWAWLKPRWVIALAGTSAVLVLTAVGALVPVWVGQARIAHAEANRVDPLTAPVLSTPAQLGPGFASLRTDDFDVWFYEDREIQPAVSTLKGDFPRFPQCNGQVPAASNSDQTPECVVATPDADKTLALVGDSHMVQWVPGIVEALNQAPGSAGDYRVVLYGRERCPFSTQATAAESTDSRHICVGPATQTLQQLRELNPDVVVMTNRVRTDMTARADEEIPGTAGYVDVMEPLVKQGARVIALEDSPAPVNEMNIGSCLEGSVERPERCAFDLTDALQAAGTNAALRAAAESVDGAEFVPSSTLTCTSALCPAVIGSTAVYRDSNHITASYSVTTAPWFAHVLGLDGTGE